MQVVCFPVLSKNVGKMMVALATSQLLDECVTLAMAPRSEDRIRDSQMERHMTSMPAKLRNLSSAVI